MMLWSFLNQGNKVTLRGTAGFLGDNPLVCTSEMEKTGDHGIEFGNRHGVFEEKVRDNEREGFGGWKDVK